MKISQYLEGLKGDMEGFRKSLTDAVAKKKMIDIIKKYPNNAGRYFFDSCKSGDLAGVKEALSLAKFNFIHYYGLDENSLERGLEIAVKNNHLDIAKYLMQKGLNAGSRSNSGWILVDACQSSTKEMVKFLLTKMDIHFCKDSPLNVAVEKNRGDIIEVLLDKYLEVHGLDYILKDSKLLNLATSYGSEKLKQELKPHSHLVMGSKFGVFDDEDET